MTRRLTRAEWKQEIKKIPRGTTYQQAADIIGQSYHRTRNWMVKFGRQIKTSRKRLHLAERARTHAKYFHLAWETTSNADLARQLGICRERTRQLRQRFGKPLVEARGRRNGK